MAKKVVRFNQPRKVGRTKLVLPTEPDEPSFDFASYATLIYGVGKIGKTTWASTFPSPIMFCTEPGARGIRVAKFNNDAGGVTSWDILEEGVELLIAGAHDYKVLIVDTVTRAYELAMAHVCAARGIEHPNDVKDFGSTWGKVKSTFNGAINRVLQSGMGVVLIAHSKTSQVERKDNNETYSVIEPAMPGQCRGVIEPMVDMTLFADYYRLKTGEVIRVVMTEGDDLVVAGHRESKMGQMPRFLRMPGPRDERTAFDVLQSAFEGNEEGISPEDLQRSPQTSVAGAAELEKTSTKKRKRARLVSRTKS